MSVEKARRQDSSQLDGKAPAEHARSGNGHESAIMLMQNEAGNRVLKPLFSAAQKAADDGLPDYVRNVLLGPGQPLEDITRVLMESYFGYDFSKVRIYTGTQATRSANAVNAKAYTVNQNIVFDADNYSPNSTGGKHLLAHELAHVIQQSKTGSFQDKIEGNNSSANLEVDAEKAARAVNRGQQARVTTTAITPVVQLQSNDPTEAPSTQWVLEGGRLSQESLDRLREELRGRGVSEESLRDQYLIQCSEFAGRLTALLQRLDRVIGSNMSRNGLGRVVNAWNRPHDDLGVPEARARRGRQPGPYPTILHFINTIDAWAARTIGGENWNQAILQMPKIRLAGRQPIAVHPRTLYFVAAAQARMDILARIPAGERHYVAPGFYRDELQDMRQELGNRDLQYEDYNRFIRQLRRMDEEMEQQRRGDVDEYPDPEMMQWFGQRHRNIASLREIQRPSELPAAVARLRSILGRRGPGGTTHGLWAVDPHGTDHALGNAIDIGNAAGRAAFTNMGMAQYRPFVWSLMDHYYWAVNLSNPELLPESGTPEAEWRRLPGGIRGLRPRALGEDPQVGRIVAQLLREYGEEWRARILSNLPADERSREQRQEEDAALDHARTAMRRHARHLLNSGRLFPQAIRTRMRAEARRLRHAQAQSRNESAHWLYWELMTRIIPQVGDLYHQARENAEEQASQVETSLQRQRSQERTNAAEGISPNTVHHSNLSLSNVTRELHDAPIDEFADMRSLQRLVRTSQFERWLENVRQYPLYDQPRIVTQAIHQVRGHSTERPGIMGSHHWQVVDRNVLEGGSTYREALSRDMNTRSVAEIQRILRIMAESERGPEILQNDADFRQALQGWAENNHLLADTLIQEILEPMGESND